MCYWSEYHYVREKKKTKNSIIGLLLDTDDNLEVDSGKTAIFKDNQFTSVFTKENSRDIAVPDSLFNRS